MKLYKIFLISLIAFLAVSSAAVANDFGWTKDFNIQAQADPSGIRARLATRFNLGDVQVKAILSNFDKPSDAYIVMRLGEMSGKQPNKIYSKYKHNKGKGWGVLAKSLGIKPGGKEFHALKRDHDLYHDSSLGQVPYSKQEGVSINLVVSAHNKVKSRGKGKK